MHRRPDGDRHLFGPARIPHPIELSGSGAGEREWNLGESCEIQSVEGAVEARTSRLPLSILTFSPSSGAWRSRPNSSCAASIPINRFG